MSEKNIYLKENNKIIPANNLNFTEDIIIKVPADQDKSKSYLFGIKDIHSDQAFEKQRSMSSSVVDIGCHIYCITNFETLKKEGHDTLELYLRYGAFSPKKYFSFCDDLDYHEIYSQKFSENMPSFKNKMEYTLFYTLKNTHLEVYVKNSLFSEIKKAEFNADMSAIKISLKSGNNFLLPISRERNVIINNFSKEKPKPEREIAFFELSSYLSANSNSLAIKNFMDSNYKEIYLSKLEDKEKTTGNLLLHLNDFIKCDCPYDERKKYYIKKTKFHKMIFFIKTDFINSIRLGKKLKDRGTSEEYERVLGWTTMEELTEKIIPEIKKSISKEEFDEWRLLIMLNNPGINIE